MVTAESGSAAAPARGGYARLMQAATYAAVATAGLLIAVKAAAWVATGSVSVLSTLIDSLLDVMASLVNLIAVRHALQPADAEHRFGHGKAEAIAGLGQAAFVAGSAVFLILQAADRLLHPQPVANTAAGIAVMALSIVATVILVGFQRYVIAKTGSVAIRADSLHYTGDVLVNGSVIAALLLSTAAGLPAADPLFGIGIAFYILYCAFAIARSAFDQLMDRELPEEVRERVKAIVAAHPGVTRMHDLRTRASGGVAFIQLHLEMNGDFSLRRAHRIADEVEARIRAAFPGAEVIIHEDPDDLFQPRSPLP